MKLYFLFDWCSCVLSLFIFHQIYIGKLRGKTAVRRNADITKDLEPGSLVAVNHPDWVGSVPQIATVVKVPDNYAESLEVDITWLEHDRGSSKKAIWLRSFRQSHLQPTTIHIDNILLYNFELNPKGQTLRKTTRDELQRLYNDLKSGEWSYALQQSKRKRF